MIKPDAPIMQKSHQNDEISVTDERRDTLAHKGEALYGKYCGTGGRGICAESFAEYHIWRGEYSVARDFLVFLNAQLTVLQDSLSGQDGAASSPEQVQQQQMTENLIMRIQALLGEEVIALQQA